MQQIKSDYAGLYVCVTTCKDFMPLTWTWLLRCGCKAPWEVGSSCWPLCNCSRISDVQHFVEQAQTTDAQFILTTSLPFRELRDESQSLEEADLANAVIVQRPLNTQAPFGHSWLFLFAPETLIFWSHPCLGNIS